jgi:hypothetical protein
MKGVPGAALLAAAVLVVAPAAEAAKPRVTLKRPTIVRNASGEPIKRYERDRLLQFDTRYTITGVPRSWTASTQILITLTRGSDVFRISTPRGDAESGTWRWVVKGDSVKIPKSYPAGRYDVRLRIIIRHGDAVVARRIEDWRATVR